jgi:hypothetical protein
MGKRKTMGLTVMRREHISVVLVVFCMLGITVGGVHALGRKSELASKDVGQAFSPPGSGSVSGENAYMNAAVTESRKDETDLDKANFPRKSTDGGGDRSAASKVKAV